jgi:hypothetical protein
MQSAVSGTSGRSMVRLWALLAGFLLAGASVNAGDADPYAPDRPEPGSVEAIARDTTDPHFVTPWVAYVPEAEGIPSPTDFLELLVGAAGALRDHDGRDQRSEHHARGVGADHWRGPGIWPHRWHRIGLPAAGRRTGGTARGALPAGGVLAADRRGAVPRRLT